MRTAVRRRGQFCCSFVADLLKYLFAKNYENIMKFDKVIAKIIRVQFLCLTVYALFVCDFFAVAFRSKETSTTEK